MIAMLLLPQYSLAEGLSQSPDFSRSFLRKHCLDCHEGPTGEGGLDLTAISADISDPASFERWRRIHDRVNSGEMPPPESSELSTRDRKAFVQNTHDWLNSFQLDDWKTYGRVRGRRLTNLQLERSLHSVLGVDIPLASLMPEEQRNEGFTTVANGQPMSHFQLEQHLGVVDAALDNAFERAILQEALFRKEFDAAGICRTNPKRRTREPELIDGFAVTWSSRLIFYGRLPATTAKKDGWYRFTMRAKSLKAPKDYGVWCTIRTGKCVSSAPLLNWVTSIEATEDVQEWTFDAWIPRGDMLEVRPGDDTLKMGRFAGGQVGTGEGGPQDLPGIAIQSLIMEEIHHGESDAEISKILFGDLKVKRSGRDWRNAELISNQPEKDARLLMTRFAERAFRRPVTGPDVEPYVQLVLKEVQQKTPLLAALRTGYRALLCSPRFLYFSETPGELDSYSIASRLSYFLWGTPPDAILLNLAAKDQLKSEDVIRKQVRRMLQDQRGQKFVPDFAAQWLDLDQINFTTPDRRLYPGFDVIVEQSMRAETETYLQEMVDKNLNVNVLIDSRYTYLNERLARFYGIGNVSGDRMQKVLLSEKDHRGGLMTQGAILKVTANGTTTSPVIRGAWVSERLLGLEIPPPPTNVPAIEPDVRGAKTIREMLEKHKSDPNCASCHIKMDPPGFALENFDPAGRWRDSYPRFEGRKRIKGTPIDASFALPGGEKFNNIDEFQGLITQKPQQVAANVAEHLIAYGTGAPVSFADRRDVEEIVKRASKANYGLRAIIEEVATSRAFLIK